MQAAHSLRRAVALRVGCVVVVLPPLLPLLLLFTTLAT
jgi:hypothetical protein